MRCVPEYGGSERNKTGVEKPEWRKQKKKTEKKRKKEGNEETEMNEMKGKERNK